MSSNTVVGQNASAVLAAFRGAWAGRAFAFHTWRAIVLRSWENVPNESQTMIRHTVAFTLRHPAGSREEEDFLRAGRELGGIASVRNFECLRQVSPKCSFAFGFSMEFADRAGYEAYNVDPYHRRFVEERWKAEVTDFQEIDYEPVDEKG